LALALEAEGWPSEQPTMRPLLWLALQTAARGQGGTSEAFCAALTRHTGVALTPGSMASAPLGEGLVRLRWSIQKGAGCPGASRIGGWPATSSA